MSGVNNPSDWLDQTREEIEARWTVTYQASAVKEVLKQIGRTDLLTKWRAMDMGGAAELKFSFLVDELGFPVWLVPSKINKLSNLVTELMARPTRTPLFVAFCEMCEEIPEDIMGCPARGLIFNWPRHNMYMTLHDLQDQPLGGHGWFFHRKRDGKRLTLQPLKSLILGLGDPDAWAR